MKGARVESERPGLHESTNPDERRWWFTDCGVGWWEEFKFYFFKAGSLQHFLTD
jgi:hypothetical protein